MTTIPKFRFVALSFLSISSVIACGVDEVDETESAEADIIQFPAAVFANAPTIAYGQTLPNEPFSKSKQFSAVRFMATAGERLTGTVTAAGMKSIVYVVRKEGTKFVNVKAGGVDTAAPNIVLHTVEQSGEHFLVFRTIPRADATFSVKLEKVGGLLSCADAGQTPSLQALTGAVRDGEIPQHTANRPLWYERRECTYATGCGAAVQNYVPAPSFSFVAVKAGASFVVESKINGALPTLSPSGILSGNIIVPRDVRNPLGPSVILPVRGTVGPTCMSIEESAVKIPVDARNYIEFRVVPVAPTPNPLPSNVHPPAGVLAPVPELETIPDEEILSRFPRGATTLTFPRKQPLLPSGNSAGNQRYCHPLTSCSTPAPVSDGNQENSACMKYALESSGTFLVVEGAKVSGRDSYELVTNKGVIPIADGIGKVGSAVLRVGEDSVQLTFPPVSRSLGNERTQEVSNTTCTFSFTWPAMP